MHPHARFLTADVISRTSLTKSDKIVFTALVTGFTPESSSAGGDIYTVTVNELMSATGYSRRTVQRSLARLAEAGLVTRRVVPHIQGVTFSHQNIPSLEVHYLRLISRESA